MSRYLGDFRAGQTIRFLWSTNASDGTSITRATNGTVSVYKDNGVTQTTVGVTDTEDFDGLVGVHACSIATTDAFYVPGADYAVVLSAATIDGKVVNAVIGMFSIENRALTLSTYAQPGQGAPPATTSLVVMISYLYKAWRNRVTQDTTSYKLYGDDATTVHQKAAVGDAGGTFDKGEVASGP